MLPDWCMLCLTAVGCSLFFDAALARRKRDETSCISCRIRLARPLRTHLGTMACSLEIDSKS